MGYRHALSCGTPLQPRALPAHCPLPPAVTGDMLRDPRLVYDKADEMGALFRARVAAAEAAARADDLAFAMPE